MLNKEEIIKKHRKLLYFSILTSSFLFFLAVEKLFFFPFCFLLITLGYGKKIILFNKKRESILGAILLIILIVSFIATKKDYMMASAYLLIGYYTAIFYCEDAMLENYTNLLPIIGLMVISTFLTSEFYYLFFFIASIILYSYLLFYAFLTNFRTKIYKTHLVSVNSSHNTKMKNITKKGRKFSLFSLAIIAIFILFFLMPRTSWQISVSRNIRSQVASGFSKKIESRNVSELLSVHNVYFAVKTRNKYPYFKGVIYNKYDGTKWETTLPSKVVYQRMRHIAIPGKTHGKYKKVRETYYIEGYQGDIIFYRGMLHKLMLSSYKANLHAKYDRAGNISLSKELKKRNSYSIETSYTRGIYSPDKADEALWAQKFYLNLPFISDAVRKEANRLSRNAKSDYHKAQLIEGELKNQYSYNLSSEPGKEEWTKYLLRSKQGFCIHFATAMVVMLRLNKIPARVVTGFLAKTYERGRYIVTNEDAHAWVEAYFPKKGWVTFEPTPAQSDYLSGMDFWKRLYYDMRVWWLKNVIGYSRFHQRTIYRYIKMKLKQLFKQKKLVYGVLGGLIFLIFFIRLRKRKKKTMKSTYFVKKWKKLYKKLQRKKSSDASSLFYKEMLEFLEKINIQRYTTETPYEFEKRVEKLFPKLRKSTSDLTSFFYQVKFGHKVLSKVEGDQIEKNLQVLRQEVTVLEKEMQENAL